MCQFKSGIILKSRVEFGDGMTDSHQDILESLGIEDNYIGASMTFVRAELKPENNEWWTDPATNPEKWKFVVDQDITPDWFDTEEHEKVFREAVADWWKAHVLVDQMLDELNQGYYRLKRCEVKKLCKDVKILLCDSSQVGEMSGSSQVGVMRGSSQVGVMWESSQVGVMWESSQVGEMRGSSQVGEMRGSSQVGVMCGSSQVGVMWGSSQVGEMRGSSQVGEMRGSSQVGVMRGSSTARDFKNYPDVKIWVSEEGQFTMEVHKSSSGESERKESE